MRLKTLMTSGMLAAIVASSTYAARCPATDANEGLFTAVLADDVAQAGACLRAGADANTLIKRPETGSEFRPLVSAARKGNAAMVKLLLRRGAEIDATELDRENIYNGVGETALRTATAGGHAHIVALLIQSRANLNTQNANGETALHKAVAGRHRQILQQLIKARANAQIRNRAGRTPFIEAMRLGHTTEAELLLLTVKPTDADSDGSTPVMLLAGNNCWPDPKKFLQRLVKAGFKLNQKDSTGATVLIAAVKNHCSDLVEALIAMHANLDLTDAQGASALTHAHAHNAKYLEVLLNNAGAKPQPEHPLWRQGDALVASQCKVEQKYALIFTTIPMLQQSGIDREKALEILKQEAPASAILSGRGGPEGEGIYCIDIRAADSDAQKRITERLIREAGDSSGRGFRKNAVYREVW